MQTVNDLVPGQWFRVSGCHQLRMLVSGAEGDYCACVVRRDTGQLVADNLAWSGGVLNGAGPAQPDSRGCAEGLVPPDGMRTMILSANGQRRATPLRPNPQGCFFWEKARPTVTVWERGILILTQPPTR